jgi:hypothetical protein
MAEQQRESDELLHNGIAAFERGEIEAARQLLNAAVQRGGAHDVALAFLTRIDRINAAAPAAPAEAASPTRPPFPAAAPTRPRGRPGWGVLAFSIIALGIAGAVAISWDQWRTLVPAFRNGLEPETAPARTVQEPLIVPRSGETAIERARALAASGKLYDALRAIDLVRSTDALRGEADKLKAQIQRELLAHYKSDGGIELTNK